MMKANNSKIKKLILASSSYTRKNLLTKAGIDFEIDPSIYEEDMTLPMSPKELVIHFDKAGTYGILENGEKLIERIEGSKTNVAGLPMEELMDTLKDY